MRAFASFLLACAALSGASAAAQGPVEGLRPSEPAAIVDAVRSCRNAATAERLDEALLTADGWAAAQLQQEGRTVASPIRMFGRLSVLLIALPTGSGCMILARIEGMQGLPPLIEAMRTAFGQPASQSTPTRVIWGLGTHIIVAEPAGARERPAIRISVMHTSRSSQ